MMNRKAAIIVVIVLVCILSWSASFAAQEPAGQALNIAALTQGLTEDGFLLVLFVTLITGASGGIVYELLILQGNIELPHWRTLEESEESKEKYPYAIYKHMLDLAIVARIIIGALAAIVGLWIFNPKTTFSWLAIAVISGSAGISIFRSMQDRLLAAMAQKDVSDLKNSLKSQASKLQEVKNNLPRNQTTDKAFEILSEAKGVSDPWL